MQAIGEFIEARDFEGAEEILANAMGSMPQHEPFLHFQYGQLYSQWNKLSSALDHLLKAAELAKSKGDETLLVLILEQIRVVKKRQGEQQP